MVTLCRLTQPAEIRPPRSGPLASFTFFTTRLRQRDGRERLYLHMGYFATLSDAQQWSQYMRTRYPNAVATPAPLSLWQQPNSDAAVLLMDTTGTTPAIQEFPPAADAELSDTQVMRILETRHPGAVEGARGDSGASGVELLRPDDTETRRTLKAAVVQGVLVPFAVQLEWSLQPIDADRVPRLDIFKGYTLYRTEKRRGGRSCYFLRLGFFRDAISANEVASRVRATFTSAAVVPVTEQELLHADEARIDTAAPAGPFHAASDELHPVPRPAIKDFRASAASVPAHAGKPKMISKKPSSSGRETLEETLEALAQREMWSQPDPLGIRECAI